MGASVEDRYRVYVYSERMLGMKKYWGSVIYFTHLGSTIGAVGSNFLEQYLKKIEILYGDHPNGLR